MGNGIVGTGLASILRLKPTFLWDANDAKGIGGGIQGDGQVALTLQDIDSLAASSFSVWDSGQDRFQVVNSGTEPNKVFGPVGDFSDGKVQNYWSTSWLTTNLGFAVTTPTTSTMLGEDTGNVADIINGGSLPDVTYVDTDEVQDSVIERSNSRSATYSRVFQILIKSEDDEDPNGNVEIGMNTSSGTRTTDASGTWFRELPGDKGWYAAMYLVPAGSTIYITMKFALGTGRWLLSSPMFYNQYSTFENIVRAPIPRYSSTVERGQWAVYTTNSEFKIPTSGWLGMSVVLPDRSTSNGHKDYAGTSNYGTMGLMSWSSGNFRIRVFMSTTYDHLIVQMDESGTSFAYLDLADDWDDFEQIGLVVTWGFSNSANFAYLYVNGVKVDAQASAANWYPETLAPSTIYIGSDGASGSAADCWISKMAIGRKPLHRSQARVLSKTFRDVARGGRIGSM